MNRTFLKLAACASLTLAGAFPGLALAQGYVYSSAPPVQVTSGQWLDDQQLDQLTGSIALYPDPLVAQILPASTYPLEVTTADQWMHLHPELSEAAIDAQNWDASIQALIHYPQVLDMMATNIDWTTQLGQAFLNQPTDVMNSIQRLRAEAQAAGTLVSTPQQQVVYENGVCEILPVNPEVIYVPIYDPSQCFVRYRVPRHDLIRFSVGFHIGSWLDKGFDWRNHHLDVGERWDVPRDRHVITGRQWHRDDSRPVVVEPRRPDRDEYRGYEPRVEQQQQQHREARPAPTPRVENRPEARPEPPRVESHTENRPQPRTEARPAPTPAPTPAPRVENRPSPRAEARPAPEARPAAPAPHVEARPAPEARPSASPRAFGADGGGRAQVEHEESRGQASMGDGHRH